LTVEWSVDSMYFVKRGSSDGNLPKIDNFQLCHAAVCTESLPMTKVVISHQ